MLHINNDLDSEMLSFLFASLLSVDYISGGYNIHFFLLKTPIMSIKLICCFCFVISIEINIQNQVILGKVKTILWLNKILKFGHRKEQ